MFPRGVLTALLVGLAAGPATAQAVAVTFRPAARGVPLTRATVFDADSDLSAPRALVEFADPDSVATARAEAGIDVVVRIDSADGSYYLDGPFRWPSSPRTRVVADVPRRTVAGAVPHDVPHGEAPHWIDPRGRVTGEPWPRCRLGARSWTCIGVPAREAGVVLISSSPTTLYAVVPASAPGTAAVASTRTARWAGLVVLDADEEQRLENVRVQLLEPRVSAYRAQGTRIVVQPAASTRVEPLAHGVYVVAGSRDRDDLLLQVDGEHVALTRVPFVPSVATLLVPFTVVLRVPVAIQGHVVAPDGAAAPGTRLQLAELVDVRDPDGRMRRLRRSLADIVSRDDGTFVLAGLDVGRYELVGMHPALGRGSATLEPGSRSVVVRLAPGARVTGRVVRDGSPAAGVWVDAPGDHDGYVNAADPLDVLAPPALTGEDGRFVIVLPPSGARELRVALAPAAVRVPLPVVAEGAMLDVGDIGMPAQILVRITYAADERCTLMAAGPIGHSALTMVEAQVIGPAARQFALPESGRWLLALRCGGREVPVEPATIEVPPQVAEWSAYVMARP